MIRRKRTQDELDRLSSELQRQIAELEQRRRALEAALMAQNTEPEQRMSYGPTQPSASTHANPSAGTVLPRRAAAQPKPDIALRFNPGRVPAAPAEQHNPEIISEVGVRRFDLVSLINRLTATLRKETSQNNRLVKYLASGSVEGLPVLRYEKRIARNRFIFTTLILAVVVLGIILALRRQ